MAIIRHALYCYRQGTDICEDDVWLVAGVAGDEGAGHVAGDSAGG
jgi:hypothetical protein